jgi:glycosyltransferase involved in cell wall biosynthesis
MLGLALSLPAEVHSLFLSFPERGLCRAFLSELHRHQLAAEALTHNMPRCFTAIRELADKLRQHRIELLCCHGYKPNLLGRPAARRLGIPAIAVSRGWTRATWKVRLYETLDRFHLRYMDRVVCVSEGQARKVRTAGTPAALVQVIRNAIFTDRFGEPDEPGRAFLQAFFPKPRTHLIGAAGRLSPEKGFGDLVAAAAEVVHAFPHAGFLLFGDGPLQAALVRQIARLRLDDHFVLAGFRADLDRWLPNFDAFVLPSYTEGLPNVVLEASAARVPVVATAVGGTPEALEDGQGGFLVPPADAPTLARRINQLLGDVRLRETLGMGGYYHVRDHFTFAAQARQYVQLFRELLEGQTDVKVAEDARSSRAA